MNQSNQKDIIALQKEFFPALSGASKRKLARANTVHLRGICPQCGKTNMKFKKVHYLAGGTSKRNVWYCKGCGKIATRDELKYVKFQ